MARKPRNYAAEYARRIARAKSLGIDRSVARGHPRKGFISLKVAKQYGVSTDLEANRRAIQAEHAKAPEKSIRETLELFDKLGLRQVFKTPLREEMEFRRGAPYRKGGIPERTFKKRYSFEDQDDWIQWAERDGLSEREAYTLWFSP